MPGWTLDLSPFHQIGLAPAEPFEVTAAVVMIAAAAGLASLAAVAFRRRDLTGV